MLILPVAVLLALGGTNAASADNAVCRQHAGAWTATGTVMVVSEFGGNFLMMLAKNVVATPDGGQSKPAGECLVGTASGTALPTTCKEGSAVTITGPLNFDDPKYANVDARKIACQ